MKSLLQFLSEAAASPGQQAKRLGLKGDGHGGWYDSKGEFAAKTEKGKLVFFNKRQRVGQDPPQTDKDKAISTPTKAKTVAQEPQNKSASPEAASSQSPKSSEPTEKKSGSTLTIVFGRFNPPTIGHEQLLNSAASVAEDDNYIIVPSRTQDSKKNPLSPDQKISIMRDMFPDHSERIINDPKIRTIFDVLQKASVDGYQNIVIVGGSDRVQEFDRLANQYNNGDLYQFDSIESRSGGARDPDSDDVKGMSASKQRKAAAAGNYELFVKGVPTTLSKEKVKELYNTVRSSMNVKEGWSLWEIAPRFDWENLREQFIGKKIYQVGDLVENLNTGLVGRIIRRGANYLICVTEDQIMFKSWIKDVSEAKKYNKPTIISGVPANQREVGTDALLKYAKSMVPGQDWGRQFINKYRKK